MVFDRGSMSIWPLLPEGLKYGRLAQMGERLLCTQGGVGSSPISSISIETLTRETEACRSCDGNGRRLSHDLQRMDGVHYLHGTGHEGRQNE